MSLTESLQQERLVVVAVDPNRNTLRLRSAAETCSDVTCSADTVVVGENGLGVELARLNAGDVVKLEGPGGRPHRIVIVRRVWDELTSPEW